jgi:hypothetical protein
VQKTSITVDSILRSIQAELNRCEFDPDKLETYAKMHDALRFVQHDLTECQDQLAQGIIEAVVEGRLPPSCIGVRWATVHRILRNE